jgi:ribosomal protein L18E
MKIIVLHDRYSNEPIIIRVDAITAIRKVIDRVEDSKEEYSSVNVSQIFFDVKEHIDVVMTKIKNAER